MHLYKVCSIMLCIILIVICSFVAFRNISSYISFYNGHRENIELYETKETAYTLKNQNVESINILQNDLSELEKQVPTLQERTGMVILISTLFEESNLHKTEFIIGSPFEMEDDLYITTINLAGVGLYEDMIHFINTLYEQEYMFQIDNMIITTEDVLQEDSFFIRMGINFYNYM